MDFKISKHDRKVTPHAGVYFVMREIIKKGIPNLINYKLGKRVKQCKYSYSDLFLSWAYSNFCGADRLEDVNALKKKFDTTKNDIKFPSPDRIGHIFKKLATPTEDITGKSQGVNHQFNTNQVLNELLIETAKKLDLINEKQSYTWDYDNTIIETEKCDARITYEKVKGYQPGVSFLNTSIPVYIEGRSGNSTASFQMKETLEKTLRQCKANNIKINVFRSDAAAYQKSVIDLMEENNIDFFIRASGRGLKEEFANKTYTWTPVEFNKFKGDVTEFNYIPFDKGKNIKTYRYVVSRVIGERSNEYEYRAIITSNKTMTPAEVVYFYNQRGKTENSFDVLKNDFNWKRIPFSYLNQNTAFLIIEAITYLLYQYIIRKFSNKVSFIKKSFRLKNFQMFVINIAGYWIEESLMLCCDNWEEFEVLLE